LSMICDGTGAPPAFHKIAHQFTVHMELHHIVHEQIVELLDSALGDAFHLELPGQQSTTCRPTTSDEA
jgi:hypothetical protein